MGMISIEGIDASGKETQAKLLNEYLKDQGFKTLLLSFPRYGTTVGKVIRDWLDNKVQLTNETFHMLMEADRIEFCKEIENSNYDFIILDRYTLSNVVYGISKGISKKWLMSLQEPVIQPDLTFVLDIPVSVSKARKSGRDKHEKDDSLLTKARATYLCLMEQEPYKDISYKIDASKASPEEIHESIVDHVKAVYYADF